MKDEYNFTRFGAFASDTGNVVNSSDPYNDPLFDKQVDIWTGHVTKSILTMPMTDKEGNIIGVVFGADVRGACEGTDLDGPLVEHGQRVRQSPVEVVFALA